jgi:hypothetical protein
MMYPSLVNMPQAGFAWHAAAVSAVVLKGVGVIVFVPSPLRGICLRLKVKPGTLQLLLATCCCAPYARVAPAAANKQTNRRTLTLQLLIFAFNVCQCRMRCPGCRWGWCLKICGWASEDWCPSRLPHLQLLMLAVMCARHRHTFINGQLNRCDRLQVAGRVCPACWATAGMQNTAFRCLSSPPVKTCG